MIKLWYVLINWVDKEVVFINVIFWIMKDDSLLFVIKVDDFVLVVIFGVILVIKWSLVENIIGNVDCNVLVIELFVNLFRVYLLLEDYYDFKVFFEECYLDCYLLNIGFFGDKKIFKEIILGVLEVIVNDMIEWELFVGLEYM